MESAAAGSATFNLEGACNRARSLRFSAPLLRIPVPKPSRVLRFEQEICRAEQPRSPSPASGRGRSVGRSNGAACIMQRRMGPRAKNDLIITKRLRQKAPGSLAPLAQNPFSVGVVDEMRSDPDSPTRFQPGQPCSHLGRAG